ncbi:BA75_03594T0 [Komagataella pastoris]|uniref:BA75_03594T0 n=1 Tax=Komagataella pastoris TaxID=4922 RepID=A0A1B2JEZ1_PICPA|nr:BA75_03594T0 [Komagataella pastoris]
MVLHNNKWDRKAKYKYLKKHGLNKKDESGASNEASSSNELVGESQVKDENATDENPELNSETVKGEDSEDPDFDPKYARRPMIDNSYRYGLESTNSITVRQDPEIERELELKRQREELEKMELTDVIKSALRDQVQQMPAAKTIDVNKMTTEDLLNWHLGDQSTKNSSLHREFDPSEQEEFNKLAQKIAKVKIKNDLKEKFGKSKPKPSGKVLQLNTSNDGSKYQKALQKELADLSWKEKFSVASEINDDLSELLGENIFVSDSVSKDDATDDIDALLKESSSGGRPETAEKESVAPTSQKLKFIDPEADAFLDDLLS